MKKLINSMKNFLSKIENSQVGWTTMEYVVGAIALVTVVTMVLNVFKEKLITAIQTLNLI